MLAWTMDWTRNTFWIMLLLVVAGADVARGQYYDGPQLDPLPAPTPLPNTLEPPNTPPRAYVAPVVTPTQYTTPYTTSSAAAGTYSVSPNPAPAVVATPDPLCIERYLESTWYTRVDYFHWNERMDGFDLVNEDGVLTTVGYERRVGRERFRAELFGGDVRYDGTAFFDDGSVEPLQSRTTYLGVRGEYELLFQPEFLPRAHFFTGLGTRFWIRDGKDAFTEEGDFVYGYQETWWTIYPYIGLEKARTTNDVEFFWSTRIGVTAFTYQHAAFADHPLWPKTGVTTKAELGWRGPRLSVAGVFETMNWGESDVVRGWLQPASFMYTLGLQAGFTF